MLNQGHPGKHDPRKRKRPKRMVKCYLCSRMKEANQFPKTGGGRHRGLQQDPDICNRCRSRKTKRKIKQIIEEYHAQKRRERENPPGSNNLGSYDTSASW